jgi:hypothetical protein
MIGAFEPPEADEEQIQLNQNGEGALKIQGRDRSGIE